MQEIQKRLNAALSPSVIDITDETADHAHHRGAREKPGSGHYNLTIVAESFEGKSRLQRHRMIYSALGELMAKEIHALKIDAKSPSEL